MPLVPVSSPMPLYHQVSGILLQRVLDGTYPSGSQLQPEDELAAEFDVSRATIRQAVGELVRAGLVTRKQGRGTFVLPTAQRGLGQVFRGSLVDLIRETKRGGIRDVSIARETLVPERVAEQLGLDPPQGTVVRRTRTIDQEAFAYTISYLNDERGNLLSEDELCSSGLMQLLESKGVAFASARQTICAQMGDPVVSQALSIPLGAPVLFVERVLFDAKTRPVEFVRSWYRGDLYEFTVTLDGDAEEISSQFA